MGGLETGVKHGTIPLCINYRVELRRFKLFPDSGPTPVPLCRLFQRKCEHFLTVFSLRETGGMAVEIFVDCFIILWDNRNSTDDSSDENSNERSPPPRKFRVIKEELRFEEVNDQIREKQRDPNLNVQHSRKDLLETSEREDKLFF